jgi:hypothetical protein
VAFLNSHNTPSKHRQSESLGLAWFAYFGGDVCIEAAEASRQRWQQVLSLTTKAPLLCLVSACARAACKCSAELSCSAGLSASL